MSLRRLIYSIPVSTYEHLKEGLEPISFLQFHNPEKGKDYFVMRGARARIELHRPDESNNGSVRVDIVYAPYIFPDAMTFNNEFSFTPLTLPRRARKLLKSLKPLGAKYDSSKRYRGSFIPVRTQ